MRRIFSVLIVAILSSLTFGQSLISTGSIYEGEFTPDKKISGLFTYMNNSDQTLQLEVERITPNGSEMVINREVESRRGRQVRVYEQEFSSAEEQVFGNYSITFFLNDQGVKKDIIFRYNNNTDYAPFLRVVSVIFSGVNEDDNGRYLDVRVDWQTIRQGTETDNRKCYLKN